MLFRGLPQLRVGLAAVLAAAAAAVTCATNPATGKRQLMLMSEADEIQLGRESDQEVRKEMGIYKDAELQRYVAGVGQRLSQAAHRPSIPWTYSVVDSSAVNAFALPGGFIYVTRGIMPFLRDEAELAAVLAHETGHVDARHSAAAYSKQQLLGGGLAIGGAIFPTVGAVSDAAAVGLQLVFLKFSRENELEADTLGVGYASSSGWRPDAMTALLNTLGRLDEASGSSRGVPNWALTHPPAEGRVAHVQEAVAAARNPAATTTNRPEFERHLDGLVFGDSREQGIVRGNEFRHPILRLAVRFPAGWEISNGEQQVTAVRDQQSSVAMLLQGVDDSGTSDLAQLASRTNMQQVSGDRTTINGLQAFVGMYQGLIQGQQMSMRAAYIRLGSGRGQVYVVAGVAPSSQFNGVDEQFNAAIRSFRALPQAEADRVQPNRVDFYTVRSGETWDALARGPAGGNVKASTLAIMNGSDPATPPRPGDRIRIVVGG